MSDQEHDLASEFPAAREILRQLKVEDSRYQALAAEYHVLNKEIFRLETGIEAGSDERMEDLKKQRLIILDEIAEMIAQAQKAA